MAAIYNHYVLMTVITFEEEPITKDEMLTRLKDVQRGGYPWLVAEADAKVLGYAYAAQWKGRCAYRYSAESSVYLAEGAKGRGLGAKLYEALFARLREMKLHTVIGGIALPNDASIRLHEKFGFKKVAHFKETGYKLGKWIDVGYWQAPI